LPDEQIATDALMGRIEGLGAPHGVIFVMDATNIERNLYLYTQLVDLGLPMMVVLTMTDHLGRNDIHLDIPELARLLNAPVYPVSPGNRVQMAAAKQGIRNLFDKPFIPSVDFGLPEQLRDCSLQLMLAFQGEFPMTRLEAEALLLESGEFRLQKRLLGEVPPRLISKLEQLRAQLSDLHPNDLAIKRYRWASSVVAEVEQRRDQGPSLSQKIDKILTHRALGLLIFASIMFFVFQAIYTGAVPLMDLIEGGAGALGQFIDTRLSNTPILRSLLVDGVIGGVGAVVVFLPQILILFLLVAFLEDSGYLARAAFLMDKLLGWTGLNGRAFIPLLSSFACAIPGIMAARVMADPKARLATILVAPLMSCSARLPVYILLISAFIEPKFGPGWAAFSLFAMHALGLLVAMPIAWFLNHGVLKTPGMPFIMEMPPYRWPNPRTVVYRSYMAGKKFLLRAGTIIFLLSIVIWSLSYFPRPDSVAQEVIATSQVENEAQLERELASAYLEQSYLSRIGKTIQPVFAPLGYDWKITVGILGAFPAREVIISTLGIIYQSSDEDDATINLQGRMRAERKADGSPLFTPLLAISLMVFFALCSQCMSTLVTVQRELNSWKWATFMFVYMTGLAYLAAMATFQLGRLIGFA